MGRLKLFGEPEGGGTDDHSALSNLDYGSSGHSGFAPSQGEALIDILRLNQNLIRDSEGNDRLQLATASPQVTLTGDVRLTGRVAIGGENPQAIRLLMVQPSVSPSTSSLWGVSGNPSANIPSGGTSGQVEGLNFMMGIGGGGPGTTVTRVASIAGRVMAFGFQGTVTDMFGLYVDFPYILAGSPSVATYSGIDLFPINNTHIVDAYGVRVQDITNNTGFCRLLEAGPATPYLRLVGGGDPPADKSNLYLKFGSTLYRVVKSGNYITLEAA